MSINLEKTIQIEYQLVIVLPDQTKKIFWYLKKCYLRSTSDQFFTFLLDFVMLSCLEWLTYVYSESIHIFWLQTAGSKKKNRKKIKIMASLYNFNIFENTILHQRPKVFKALNIKKKPSLTLCFDPDQLSSLQLQSVRE